MSSFTSDIDTHIEQAKTAGVSKKEELLSVAREVYDNRQDIIASAKAKAASFTGIPEATIDTWVAKIQTELSSAFSKIESQFNETETVTKKRAPRKAPSEKSE